MKKWIGMMLAACILAAGACKKDKGVPRNTIAVGITIGSWKVASFAENNEDMTAGFEGFAFSFNEDQSVIAVKDGAQYTGTWYAEQDQPDQLHIFIGYIDPLEKLNDSWKVRSQGNDGIELRDDAEDDNTLVVLRKI